MSMFFNILSMGGYDADYQALLDRATTLGYTHPSTAQKTLQNQFVLDLKSAGIWSELDILYVFATDGNSSFAQLNWKTPASYEITQVASPTFTTNEGFDFNGTTQYLNTNWAPGTHGVNYTRNDASIGAWVNDNVSATRADLGCSNNADGSTNGIFLNSSSSTGNMITRTNDNSGQSTAVAASVGFNVGQRRASNDKRSWKDGVQINSSATASTALPTVNLFLGATNGNGTATVFSTREISMAFAGSSLTGMELDFYNAWNTYFTSL